MRGGYVEKPSKIRRRMERGAIKGVKLRHEVHRLLENRAWGGFTQQKVRPCRGISPQKQKGGREKKKEKKFL